MDGRLDHLALWWVTAIGMVGLALPLETVKMRGVG